jgi:hypothetical protein
MNKTRNEVYDKSAFKVCFFETYRYMGFYISMICHRLEKTKINSKVQKIVPVFSNYKNPLKFQGRNFQSRKLKASQHFC